MYLWAELTRNPKHRIITVMDELYDRIDRAIPQINALQNKVAKRDLIKMVRGVDAKMTELDQELVECRRMHRETPRYRELREQASELIDNLEKYITFAALIG